MVFIPLFTLANFQPIIMLTPTYDPLCLDSHSLIWTMLADLRECKPAIEVTNLAESPNMTTSEALRPILRGLSQVG